MKGMTLGLLDGIVGAISSGIMGVLGKVVEWLFNHILAPIINLIFNLISYILGIYFYGIASFLLGLIDFVELLFRALAGLEASNANNSISLSIDGESGDILIQLIRHPSIQQAFLAMCIVGLFLLVVTSVFQIIKVEYTTEGAKNSKTPILQKAFKGLANLMLLPILCIFGIVFSNQLLGLLDKATQGEGSNPTIAGTLFATAASDAHYRKSAFEVGGQVGFEIHLITTPPQLYPQQIMSHVIEIAWNSFAESLEGTGWGDGKIISEYKNDEKERARIDTAFSNQEEGYCYYLIENVTNYYDYSQINYLLLIFGGCVVLKCLYFTCFGMVVRLYKCAVLFIISPAVIGMTPINEGGLGKWRGQFIGQVLSAYGTILSINLFFIIVRVLLNVEVSFVNKNGLGSQAFSASLMTGLLKAIFVMAGCLLIEKFSKELGGYFGAEDAMGAGKDMSKQVGDVAMKGVKVAATVAGAAATGGASLAGSIGGMIAGAKNGGGGIAGAIKGGWNASPLGAKVNKWTGAAKDRKQAKAGKRASARLEQNNQSLSQAQSDMTGIVAKEAELQAKLKEAEATRGKHGMSPKPTKQLKNELKNIQQKRAQKQEQIDSLQSSIETDTKTAQASEDAQGRIDERKQKRRDSLARTYLLASGFAAQSRQDVMGWIPGYSQFVKPIDETAHKGVKLLGDDAEQAMAYADKQKQKKKEDEYDQLLAKAKEVLIGSAGAKVVAQVAAELDASQHNMSVQANNVWTNTLQQLAQIENTDNAMSESERSQARINLISDTQRQFNQMGAEGVDFDTIRSWMDGGSKTDIDIKQDLKIDLNGDEIKKAINDAMKKSGGAMKPEVLRDELQKIFNELGLSGNKNMLMQIEAIIKKVMNDLK